jgi:hypothetical protein
MDIAYARARQILTFAALLLAASTTLARPLLLAPAQRLTVPTRAPDAWPNAYGYTAIDGDSLLVATGRFTSNFDDRVDGVFLFQRDAAGKWNYVKPLYEGAVYGFPLLNGNLATVQIYGQVLVFERGAQGWAQTATIPLAQPNSFAFRLDDGAIYIEPRNAWNDTSCPAPYQQWRKVNGTWQMVATIGPQRCSGGLADVNDSRALYFRNPYESNPQTAADVYGENTPIWSVVENMPALRVGNTYVNLGPYGTLSGNVAYVASGYLFRNGGGGTWASAGRLVEPETELQPQSNSGKLRGTSLFLYGGEEDYEIPSHDEDNPTQWHTLRIYRPRADGFFDYYARLGTDFDLASWSASEDGTRLAVTTMPDNFGMSEGTQLYVYDIPDTATFPGTQQDTFESGNFSKWTATVGQFSVVPTSVSRVLRQESLAGDAKAYLTGIDWTDQSIEADIRPTEFGGNDHWFGLATRRGDDQNYYYATFRLPNKVSLRRMKNGVVTELAYQSVHDAFVPGKSYRVRLESVGDQHAVFLDGFPVTHAKDSSFAHGHPGVVSCRTSFDADNVIVSGGTRMLLRLDTYKRNWAAGWYGLTPGNWQLVNEPSDDINEHGEYVSYVLRQGDISGDAKWFSKIGVGNQVVSARVRPMSYGTTTGTNDAWVGIAAHVIDDRNYYYVTLRRRNEFSLRRMVNGQVQVIATVPQAATLNNWYDLRLEIIGIDIRAYVNGDLKISARDPTMTGGGKNAILMYKTAADFYHYIAYQP